MLGITKRPQERFWLWFIKNEAQLFAFDPTKEVERERLFNALAKELVRIDSDLTFEFGPPNLPREFVVSAGGIKRAFGAVSALVAAAPHLKRWSIIAFRPRRSPCSIEIGGQCINPDQVEFSLFDNGRIPGIQLFIPGYRHDQPMYRQIGYLFLDSALGEFDVETKVGPIEMFASEAETDGRRYPLSVLPKLFDQLVAQLGLADSRA